VTSNSIARDRVCYGGLKFQQKDSDSEMRVPQAFLQICPLLQIPVRF